MPPAHQARDYQRDDIDSILNEFKDHRSTLYVAATGLGKTKVAVDTAERMQPKRTLMLAHRNELITQACAAFERHGLTTQIEKAELSAMIGLWGKSQVVIASVQTMLSGNDLRKRMERFDPKDFGLIIVDEAHHYVSPGFKSVLDYFSNGNPEARVLGLTATPDRADEEALGQIFETVAAERDILWGRDNGWLVDIEQRMVHVGDLDFSNVRPLAGDLNQADLAAVMEAEGPVQKLVMATLESLHGLDEGTLLNAPVEQWAALCEGRPRRRALVFTVSVKQAEMCSNIFNRAISGVSSWVCDGTRPADRKRIFDEFGSGHVSILVNVGIATEGYDNPAVDLVVMGRPTKSRSLYAQMIGRGTRTITGLVDGLPGAAARIAAIKSSSKPRVTVMDFVGNSGRHTLMSAVDVLGGRVSDAAVERARKQAEIMGKQGKAVMMVDILEEEEEKLRKETEERRRREEARKLKLVAKTAYTTKFVDPFSALGLQPARERGWDRGKKLSEKQANVLRKAGYDPTQLPYHQAVQVLNETFRRWQNKLSTPGQMKLLKRFYPEGDFREMKMQDASQLIDKIKTNNWRPVPLEQKKDTSGPERA